jgi:hypothetical protein
VNDHQRSGKIQITKKNVYGFDNKFRFQMDDTSHEQQKQHYKQKTNVNGKKTYKKQA